jgi:glycosyltransferase involved in cell wall biosynthesis
VIGRNPPHSLISAWNGIGGVRFTGTVDDIKPHLAGASAAIVPLRVGGGTRLKILELMAAGIPVISTTIGAEGLPLEDRTHFLRADTPDELDSAIDNVLVNPGMAAQMADRALADVVEPNSWSHCADVFLQLALGNTKAVSYGNVATKPQVAGRQ